MNNEREQIKLIAPILCSLAKDFKINFLDNFPAIPENSNPHFFNHLVLILSNHRLFLDNLFEKAGLFIPRPHTLMDEYETPNGDYFIWTHDGSFYNEVGWEYAIKNFDKNERPLTFRELIYASFYYKKSFLNTYAAGSCWNREFAPFLTEREGRVVAAFDKGIILSSCGTASCIKPIIP